MGRFALALCVLSILGCLTAQEVGPEHGSLVIVGGAMRDPAILERFIELAGGPDAPVVVIPTAGGRENYGQNWSGLRSFREAGLKHVTLLHTHDRAVADSEEFVQPLLEARGVFFTGGRQWRLAVIWVSFRVPSWLEARLVEYLYPDDLLLEVAASLEV